MSSPERQIEGDHEGVIGVAADGRATIRFERRLDHPVERVWRAVSEPAEMERWLAYRARVDLRVGGRHELWLGGSDSEAPVHSGTITSIEIGRSIEVDYPDGSTLRWELHPDGVETRLIFVDTRPRDERARNSVLAGWHLRVDHLPAALDGVGLDWQALDRDRDEHGYIRPMAEIYWHYRNRATAERVAGMSDPRGS